MVIEGNIIERHTVEAGTPQGSPVSLIIFTIYTSGLIKFVDEMVSRVEWECYVEAVRWVAMGSDIDHVITRLKGCARVSIDSGEKWKQEFDTAKPEAALYTTRQGHP
jgi:hypothetical protein